MKTKHDDHDHPEGLAHDLERLRWLADRRSMLRLMAGASLLPLLGCGDSSGLDDAGSNGADAAATNADAGSTTADGSTTTSCSTIPEETAGPYPADGSNGANALSTNSIIRSDIRSSFGSLSGTAEGIPLTVNLSLVNTSSSCAALSGYAIYLWHCDRAGQYSLYTITDQNYLRGVQATDANGTVSFTSIFPACYSGRWPHIHFEIYPNLISATGSGNKIKTSQLALPAAACNTVYATTGYSQSVTNLSQITLASDNVFSDGTSLQMATVTGSVSAGYVASLTVGIAI